MAAHRYWRLYARIYGDGGYQYTFSVHSFELHTSVGGTDVVGFGTASSSGVFTGGTGNFQPENAFDHDDVTEAATNAILGQSFPWVQYDFGPGNDKDIQEFKFSGYIYNLSTGIVTTPFAISIAYSDDGVTWTLGDSLTAQCTAVNSGVPAMVAPNTYSNLVYLGPTSFHTVGSMRFLGNAPDLSPLHFRYGDGGIRLVFGYNGDRKISGTVAIDGVTLQPIARVVRLYNRLTGLLVGETRSDPSTGYYEFRSLNSDPFYVLAIDDTNNYNAAIRDNVVGVPQ